MNTASLDVAARRRATSAVGTIAAASAVAPLVALFVARNAIVAPAVWATIALVPAAAAAVVDVRRRRVPDHLVAAAVVVPVAVALADGGGRTGAFVIAGALAMAVPLLALHLASPALVGFGDVKLAAALGAAVGLVDVRLAIPGLAVASGATLLSAVARRSGSAPFAPGLVFGAAVVVAGASCGWGVPR